MIKNINIPRGMFRAGLLYLIVGLFLISVIDQKRLKLKSLDELKCSMDYLVLFSDGLAEFQKKRFQEQIRYYERLHALIPGNAEVNGILGFCYYWYSKDVPKAIRCLEAARKGNPYYFWYPYNLGMIYFENRDYQKAIACLSAALQTDPRLSRETFRRSYILKNFDDPLKNVDGLPDLRKSNLEQMLQNHIEEARKNAHRMLIVSYQKIKNIPVDERLLDIKPRLKIF